MVRFFSEIPTIFETDSRLSIDGHYLNLPVVDEGGSLVGIVDVLKLTYATLEQVRSLSLFDERCSD